MRRTLEEHQAWVCNNADYFTVFYYPTRQRVEVKTLDEAKQVAARMLYGYERYTQPAMIYAVKDIHSVMTGTYHVSTGYKPVKV